MKKLLLSIFLLTGISGVTKPMEYSTSALIGSALAAGYSMGYIMLSTDPLQERLKKSAKWITTGALMGVYAQVVAPAPVCIGVVECTETTIWYGVKALSWVASAAAAVSFHREVRDREQGDLFSRYYN